MDHLPTANIAKKHSSDPINKQKKSSKSVKSFRSRSTTNTHTVIIYVGKQRNTDLIIILQTACKVVSI